MEIHGTIAPASLDEAEATSDRIGLTAQVIVRETAKATEFDREKYSERVTGDVIGTVRNALFVESFSVTVSTRAEFDDWRSTHEEYVMVELGNPDIERIARHAVPSAETMLATTFQNGEDATVNTLRRNAFGHVYCDALLEEEAEGDDDVSAGADDDTAADAAEIDDDATGADQ